MTIILGSHNSATKTKGITVAEVSVVWCSRPIVVGKKIFLNLVVMVFSLLNLLLDGRNEMREWPG